ncbi:hypothetical protein FQN60_011257 [Etheostoma spectabile]|uniref:Uncharacterized protein n=1 Tax=Etheostoma spectabile TaxID=54343 RepID=A0A5J5DRG2_9PERO|nr:hypothetical protein FQN60_011257 [Etheostoma spectabile]
MVGNAVTLHSPAPQSFSILIVVRPSSDPRRQEGRQGSSLRNTTHAWK